ncbi:MAG: hypothetical protein PHP21_01205 [Patescibacteria group bacterium]|nr:hypothetical protein [Patescibacteria group bacterium]MDD5554240.1 hypothetical protein [Patescibacteria group bacterium]
MVEVSNDGSLIVPGEIAKALAGEKWPFGSSDFPFDPGGHYKVMVTESESGHFIPVSVSGSTPISAHEFGCTLIIMEILESSERTV